MNKLTSISVVLCLFILSACADVTHIRRNDSRDFVLDSNSRTYISVPRDGSYGAINYNGSGTITAGIVLAAFSLQMTEVEIGDHQQTFEDALAFARKENYEYLIVPKILHWEDRNTAWSGRPSKASINLAIVDVRTGNKIDSVVIDARSSAVRMTDPSPEDALPGPVEDYVQSLTFR